MKIEKIVNIPIKITIEVGDTQIKAPGIIDGGIIRGGLAIPNKAWEQMVPKKKKIGRPRKYKKKIAFPGDEEFSELEKR